MTNTFNQIQVLATNVIDKLQSNRHAEALVVKKLCTKIVQSAKLADEVAKELGTPTPVEGDR